MSEPMIELRDIHKKYGAVHAIRGVSLAVAAGEVRVLIGPSGCGKSTMLRCMNLLEQPTSGTLRVGASSFVFGDKTPAPKHLGPFRAQLGMVFQQFDLFPHLTAIENVMAGPRIVKKMPQRQAAEIARALLAKVGLSEKADVYPRNLSGGQAQRVAIARALSMEPSVILFDEATSALDPELVDEVLGVMRQLAHEGKTMVIVTHEMRFARDVAHRVCFMDEGKILEDGSADEVIGNPTNPRTSAFLRRFHLGAATAPAH